jgi:hypothetical protein
VSERCFEFITRCSGAYSCPYSLKCLEGKICELRPNGVLSSSSERYTKTSRLAEQRYAKRQMHSSLISAHTCPR